MHKRVRPGLKVSPGLSGILVLPERIVSFVFALYYF